MNQYNHMLFGLIYRGLIDADVEVDPRLVKSIADQCANELEAFHGPPEETPYQIFEIHEAARVMKCSVKTVREFIRSRGLQATVKNPGSKKPRYLITSEAIQTFLRGQPASLRKR